MLSDPEAVVIRRWGLANPERPGIPHPTSLVVDDQGRIHWIRQDVDFSARPAPAELLAAVDAMLTASESASARPLE